MVAMSHDYRIALGGHKIYFCMSEINLGITIIKGMLAPLQAKLGDRVLKEMCLSGKQIYLEQALSNGIIDLIYQDSGQYDQFLISILACNNRKPELQLIK